MTSGLSHTSVIQTCRLCLEPVSETCTLSPIYENVNLADRYGFNESIPEIISSCIGIEINPNDGLSTSICSSCEKSLISSHTFRLKCLKANRWLSQFKIKTEDADDNESEEDTAGHSINELSTGLSAVHTVKEEVCEESTDHESESTSSMYDTAFNSNQRQRHTDSSQITVVDHTRGNSISNNVRQTDSSPASRMCVICGLIVKRLHEHSHLKRNEISQHIIPNAADSQNSSPATAEDSFDFLMCRMFYKSIRHYVKVEFPSRIGIQFNDFLTAASETFNFNIASFEHFVDQDGYTIDSKYFINVIASDACRNNFAVGVILRKDGEVAYRPPVRSVNQTPSYFCAPTITNNVASIDSLNQTIVPPTTSNAYTFAGTSNPVASAELTNQSTFTQPPHGYTPASPVTAADLQAYLVRRKGQYLLQEYKEKSMLSDKSRRFLINAAVDFLEENFGIYPKRMYKEALAHAIIELFPTYKTQNSSIGGIDLFLNGQTGYLNSRLKNLQNKRRSEEGTSDGTNGKKLKVVQYDDYPEENEVENDVNVEEDLTFLRNAMTPFQTEEIKTKLISTLKRRIELTTNKPSVHLRSSFPFFFSDPSLISFDYKLRYPQFEENLQQAVMAIQTNVFQILKSLKIEVNVYDDSDWPHIIQCFICLLKLLPPTATGRYSKTRQPSDQRVGTFILFSREYITDATFFENIDPFIVAYGPNRAAIQKYFIAVDGCVIDVPPDWNFVDVFDLFFKVHFVFNVDYNNNLRTFLRFFERFAYNHNGTKITNRIQEISTQLFYQQSEIIANHTK